MTNTAENGEKRAPPWQNLDLKGLSFVEYS
jgi:hypothetical protein